MFMAQLAGFSHIDNIFKKNILWQERNTWRRKKEP